MTIGTEGHFYSAFPARLLGLAGLAVVACGAVALYLSWGEGLTTTVVVGGFLLLGGCELALVVRRRQRPVLEIREDEIVYGSIMAWERKSIRLTEVETIVKTSSEAIHLRLRGDKVLRLPTGELGPDERRRATELIESALRGSTASVTS